MKLLRTISVCVFSAFTLSMMAQNNIIDEVVWWIGDQPIYKSDVEEMYQTMRQHRSDIDGDPYCVIPEDLAIELDSIEVPNNQLMSEVENQINYMIMQLGSQDKLEEYYHRSMPEIREMIVEMMRNRTMVEQVQSDLTKDIKATPSDVRKYFGDLPKDSVPFVPLQVEVQIITINPIIPREEIDEVKARLRDYTDRINKGESEFSTLAILYSEDPGSAIRGGETGFMSKSSLDPEYAAVAFNLNDTKKVSKIVQSEFGYHIIQMIEKRGDRINTRHILLRPKVNDKDLTEAVTRLDSLRADILAEKFTFEDAVYISQDKDTRRNKGQMVNDDTGTTRFEMSKLPQEVSRVVNDMSVGELSKPFIMKDPKKNTDIVAIVKLSNRIPAHRANLSDDYQLIMRMYESAAKEKVVREWIEKKIRDTYVRIEDNWRNCEFKHKGWIKTTN